MTYEQLIQHYGSQAKAASRLGYTARALQYWKVRGIPEKAAKAIEARTHGKLKA